MKLLSIILLTTFFVLMIISSTTVEANPIWTAIRYGMKPTCLGCGGICEVRASSGCSCVIDQACLRRRQQG